MRRVEKPWGHELVFAENERYAGKILHLAAGHSLSLQYHERKDETLYVLNGEVTLLVEEEGLLGRQLVESDTFVDGSPDGRLRDRVADFEHASTLRDSRDVLCRKADTEACAPF